MAKVFISYRRADSATFSGRIYDRLVAKFGRRNIFKDVDDIPAGVDFAEYIQASLQQCAVELVIIGPRWAEARTTDGRLRLDDPDDFVRIEIETALHLALTVIPILVDGASMPEAEQLPASLPKLHRLNALSVRQDPDFSRDMERVIEALEHAIAGKPGRPRSGLFGRHNANARGKPAPAASAEPDEAHPEPVAAPVAAPAARDAAEIPAPAAPISPAVNEAKKRVGTPPRRRALVAGLAGLLIVLTIVGLLATQTIGQNLALSESETATVRATLGNDATYTAAADVAYATATAAYAPTATFLATPVYPYVAKAPGPGCDKGLATWEGSTYGNGTNTPTITCFTDHTHITAKKYASCTSPCIYAETSLVWDVSTSPEQFGGELQNYTTSMDVSGISPSAQVWLLAGIADGTGVSRGIGMYGDGSYYPIGDTNYSGFNYADLSKSHQLSVTVQGTKITVSFDGHKLTSWTLAHNNGTQDIELLLTCSTNNLSCSANFANFKVTRL